jgi:hypothetical protein
MLRRENNEKRHASEGDEGSKWHPVYTIGYMGVTSVNLRLSGLLCREITGRIVAERKPAESGELVFGKTALRRKLMNHARAANGVMSI